MCVNKIVFQVVGLCVLCTVLEVVSHKTECGKLKDKNQIPWTVGIYLEKEKDYLELVCVGTILKEHYVITAAQCVSESLSNEVRKENIYVSKEFQKQLKVGSNTVRIKTKDVTSRNDYEGFLLNPAADLAVLRIDNSDNLDMSVCLDWADLNFLSQGENNGIVSFWDKQLKTLDTTFMDYDSCTLAASEDFGAIIAHDKNCFKVSTSNLVPESIGAGIYVKNQQDNRWYLEGVISAKEKTNNNEILVAATSIRHYLTWLSRVCA